MTEISRFLVHNGTAFVCCREDGDDSESGTTYAATMNLDDGNVERLSLEMDESDRIVDIAVDAQGGIWCLCEASSGAYELRHFDSKGSLTHTASLNEVADEGLVLDSNSTLFLNMDSEGNLCVTVKYIKSYCYIFDSEGQFLFTTQDSGNTLTAVTTAEGKLAVCVASDSTGWSFNLLKLDMNLKKWSEDKISLGTTSNVFGGDGAYDFYLYNSSDFLGYQAGRDEPVTLFNWTGLGLSTGDIHVCGLGDGRFAVVSASFNQTGKCSYECCIVELGTDDRTVLSMMSMQPDSSLLEIVSQFNNTNENYRVELTEYFPSYENVTDGEWEQALRKFNVELISGKIPDIIDLYGLPVEGYLDKGILDDLYPYIQNDAEINMDDYFGNILDSFSIDGKLPYITSSVSIQTIFADSRAVETGSSWTTDNLSAFLDQYGDGALTGGSAKFLLEAMVSGGGGFVNWSDRTCNFDSDDFVQLLELANRINNGSAADKAMASFVGIPNFFSVTNYLNMFEGNLISIGLPNDDGVYHRICPSSRIGIAATGEHREGAWEFVRTLLLEKQQESSLLFPLRIESFEKVAAAAMKGDSIWSNMYDSEKVTQAEVNVVRELMETARYCKKENDTISEIVLNEAAAYFDGSETVDKAAVNIQKRVTLYINEV